MTYCDAELAHMLRKRDMTDTEVRRYLRRASKPRGPRVPKLVIQRTDAHGRVLSERTVRLL